MSIDWHGVETETGWKYPYINTDTGTWWQWSEDANAYVNTGINAIGYTGDTGPQGERGPKGDPGTSVFVTSITESSEDGGANIVTLSDGHTLTIRNGNTGSRGPAGRDGINGLPGADGETGPQGPKGERGTPGAGVTVIDVSESDVDGGTNIVTFSDGSVLGVKNGNTGSQGPRGYKGERGNPGQNYEITQDDYALIAEVVLSEVDDVVTQAIEDINDEKTGAISDIEDKGEEVLNSIPDDYTELSDDVSELMSDLTSILDSTAILVADYTIDGKYINSLGQVGSSANFETKKYALPNKCKSVRVKTAMYGACKIVLTTQDVSSDDFVTNNFLPGSSFYPATNPASLITYDETLTTDGYDFVYVPHYKNDTTVGVTVTATVRGEMSDATYNIGVMQSALSADEEMLQALKMTPVWTADKYINVTNGNENSFTPTASLKYYCTQKMRCDIFDSITLKQFYSTPSGSAFYKSDGSFLSAVERSGNVGSEITISVPLGAYYFATTYYYNPSTTIASYPDIKCGISTKSLAQKAFSDSQEKALQDFLDAEVSNNPLAKIIHDGGYTALFHSIGCIGDSLASGEMYYTEGDTLHGIDMYAFSWGQCMAREIGISAYNFSVGGLDAETWYTQYANSADFTTNHVCSAYIIGLGVNDVAYADYGVGTAEDINLSDKTQNADSFYGHYGKIIQRIKEVQPKAKIFCITLPRVSEANTPYSEAIRDMAEIFDNVYIIDLAEYAADIYLNLPNAMWFGGHMTALGYQMASWHIGTYIDWIIRNNMDEFNEVQFIGTNYSQ